MKKLNWGWHCCRDLGVGHLWSQDTGQAHSHTKCLLRPASFFTSVFRKKLALPLSLQGALVICFSILLGAYHLVVSQPSYQNSLSSLLYQEQDINIVSAISWCLHLPCESGRFWSFLLGVKFMRGI